MADSGTYLDDFSGILVAEDTSRFEIGPALVHMQVRAANVGGGDLDDHIVGLLDSGVRNIFHADVAGSVINDCFHSPVLRRYISVAASVMQAAGS
jgi:hypothetical protein